MIEETEDGTIILDFSDWDPWMMALTYTLFELPVRSGEDHRTHKYGVDRLNKIQLGGIAVQLLLQNADELEYCPTEDEVLRLGKAALLVSAELALLRKKRLRNVPTLRIGFVRRK
jgi:hypothetical protein